MNNSKPLELSPKSLKIFNRVCSIWVGSAFFIAYCAHFFQIDMENCIFYSLLGDVIPAINKWPLHTYYINEAKLLWLYLPFSALVVLFTLFFKIDDLSNKEIPLHVIIVMLILCLLGFYSSIFGLEYSPPPNNSPGLFKYLFTKTFYGMVFGSVSFWAMFVLCFFYLASWFFNGFKQ